MDLNLIFSHLYVFSNNICYQIEDLVLYLPYIHDKYNVRIGSIPDFLTLALVFK